MTAPSNEFENLQSVYIRTYNRVVKRSFRDDIDDDDFSTPESQMKHACLIKDNDTATMMLLRMNLFYIVREEAKNLHPPLYFIPAHEYQETVEFRPQVIFSFEESKEDARTNNRRPKTVRVSFRLMNETSQSITQANITILKNRIKTNFPRTYKFKTGRIKMSYRDKQRGYELILTPYSEALGKTLITKILEVAGHTADWERLSVSTMPNRNFLRRDTVIILGERKRLPAKRPVAEVYLRKAVLSLHGQLEDIPLYDTY